MSHARRIAAGSRALSATVWALAALMLGMGAAACGADYAEVTVTWTAPSANEDGTPLTDLTGYRIYWGRTPGGPYPYSASVLDPRQTSRSVRVVEDGEWYFVVTAVTGSNEESRLSPEARVRIEGGKVVRPPPARDEAEPAAQDTGG